MKKVKGRMLLAIVLSLALLMQLPAFAWADSGDGGGGPAPAAGGEQALRAKATLQPMDDGGARQVYDINAGWKFQYKILDDAPAAPGYADAGWQTVNIPHSWNGEGNDAANGGNNYARTVGWYRKSIPWQPEFAGKRVYIEFGAASSQAECFVNGASVGTHKGGYLAFRFDITDKLATGDNIVALKVDNRHTEEIAPLSGDFSVMGGAYRWASLVVAQPVHVDLDDHASGGLYLTTTEVGKASAKLGVRANIVNDSAAEKTVTVKATLQNPGDFEGIAEAPPRFDADGVSGDASVVQAVQQALTIPAGGSVKFEQNITVANPHLWDGMEDPYRYRVTLDVTEGGTLSDSVSDYVGFRFYEATDEGFFLNGRAYPLRGVARHQDRDGKGYGITKEDQDEDFGLMYEIGANTVRLAHYPHDPYYIELCDKYGIVVWSEIPFVNASPTGAAQAQAFEQTTENQLREMIRQLYNHPSVCFWGISNEVYQTIDASAPVLNRLNAVAKQEDPTRRTTHAIERDGSFRYESDVLGWNHYANWYSGIQLGERFDWIKANDPQSRPLSVSEYGAGGNIAQHEDDPAGIVSTGGSWHPEEYQNKVHELALKDISARPWLWGTYVWNMFDFGSDGRNEGGQPGINDKGLVTYDRKTKKDSFFLYKANWNPDPMVYIASRRFEDREIHKIPVTIYSNCDSVELFVNGVSQGVVDKTADADTKCGIFKWGDVQLSEGANASTPNIIRAVGKIGADAYEDTITWNAVKSSSTKLVSTELPIDHENKTIALKSEVNAADIGGLLSGDNGATFVLCAADGATPVTTGKVMPGMTAVVTSANTQHTATYTFISAHLAVNKPVRVSSQQDTEGNVAQNAVDYNSATRWASATSAFPGWLEIDLGREYNLSGIKINWYDNNPARSYYYEVQLSSDREQYTTMVDRTNNVEHGVIEDTFRGEGRYVRIYVTGSSQGNRNSSIWEVEVYGWSLTSDAYAINHTERTVCVPSPEPGQVLDAGDFLSNIRFEGGHKQARVSSQSYYVAEGESLIVDENGRDIHYTVYFDKVPDSHVANLAIGKPVYFSGEEGRNDVTDPALGIRVNDGDPGSRWAAPKRGDNGTYPEWIAVDLGAECFVSEVELYFFRHGENSRAYKYEVLAASDGLNESDFTRVVDQTGNENRSGHYTHAMQADRKVRYIKINVTGCTQSGSQASINEIIVRGRVASDDKSIVAIGPCDAVEADYGTAFVSLPLPANVSAEISDGSERDVTVVWSSAGYKPTTPGRYTLSGALTLAGGITNPLNLTAAVEVIVKDKPDITPGDDLTIQKLETEYTTNPLGIGNTKPVFSWQLASDERGVRQASYRIMIASDAEKLEQGNYDVWDSAKVSSDKSVDIAYGGSNRLESGARYYWKVAVEDNHGNGVESTGDTWFEMGLLEDSDWEAEWIELDTSLPTPTKYSIEFDFTIVKDDAGFVFAAKDTSNFLMWQVNTFEKKFNGETSFRPHRWDGGRASVLPGSEKQISDFIPKERQHDEHHMTIEVDGDTVVASINGEEIDTTTVPAGAAAYGKIGFRHSTAAGDCDEQALYDNIVVKDGDGAVLFSDDFSDSSNPNFSFGEIQNEKLFIKNVLGLQKDVLSAPMYRKEFALGDKAVKRARIHASALGLYELELNGKPVSDDFFNPGWTNYELNENDNNYVMHQTFDVTDGLLKGGANVLGAVTGHGWYSGKLFTGGNNRYGTGSKLLCQLEVEYADGSTEVVPTGTDWAASGNGPITADDFQLGETYDARKEMAGWSTAGYTPDSTWKPAKTFNYRWEVTPQVGPTVKAIKEFAPKSIRKVEEGRYIIDIGQNISGIARLTATGPAGHKVTMRFAEMLQKDGSLYTANLRTAASTDHYTLKGDGAGETWQPRFTFHGFQYVEVSNYPGELTADKIVCVALSSLQEQTGTFETSNGQINQLQSNIYWGQLDNFISVPTDCPQRDERLGYTGDGQVFARTATMNMDVNQFFHKFMSDVSSNQRNDGRVADWTPNMVGSEAQRSGSFGNSGWGDAVAIIPWTLYTAYGDTQVIRDNYDNMKRWVDWYGTQANDYIVNDTTAYGDHLQQANPLCAEDVISTAFYAYSADLFSRMAAVVGEAGDAAAYRTLFNNIKAAFNDKFVDGDVRIKSNAQTAYLLALKFDLLNTQEDREKAAAHLVADIKAHDMHLTTGFIGVGYLCPILSEMGYADIAYQLVLQDTFPSWLYSVKHGATTVWERWNSYIGETGEFGDVGMNSFNHYSLGSVGEWFYNYAAGIRHRDDAPGYKEFTVDPSPGGGLSYANSSFASVYGEIVSNWSFDADKNLVMEVTVPANTTAFIHVPAKSANGVKEGGVPAGEADGLDFVEMKGGKAVFEAGSGSYRFVSDYKQRYSVLITGGDENGDAVAAVRIDGGEPQALPFTAFVEAGAQVSLQALPLNDVDYAFASWSGDVASDEDTIQMTVSKNSGLEVALEALPNDNLAVGKGVNAKNSGSESNGWGKAHLTDGIYTSQSGSLGYSSSSTKTDVVDHWVEIDLGQETEIDSIRLYPRSDKTTNDGKTPSFPLDFEIQLKADGAYETALSFEGYEAPQKKPAVLNLPETKAARYVRLAVTKLGAAPAGEDFYLQLAEMGVYRIDKTALGEVISAAEAKVEEDYTAESWATFVAAFDAAKEVYADANATPQQVDDARQSLEAALNGLATKPITPPTGGGNEGGDGGDDGTGGTGGNGGNDGTGGNGGNGGTGGTGGTGGDDGKQTSTPPPSGQQTIETPMPIADIPAAKAPVAPGKTGDLPKSVTFTDGTKADVTWKSANSGIAKIDANGDLVAVGEGTVTLTATATDGSGKTQTITVTIAKPVTKLRTPLTTVSLTKGASVTLPVCADSVNPATKKAETAAKLEWASSNAKVATVDKATGKIKAVGLGKAKITAKALNGKKLTITVKVVKKAVKLNKLTVSGMKAKLAIGKAAQLKLKLTPTSATNLTIKFKSSKPKIVSIDKAGKLTALKKGTAKITVTAGKKKYIKTITVK